MNISTLNMMILIAAAFLFTIATIKRGKLL